MIKNEDYLNKVAERCLSKAKKLGATDASAIVVNSVSENINIRNKKIDGSERSESLGINLTTYINKKKSSISSSNLNEKSIDSLVERCFEATKVTPEDELNSLPDKELHFQGQKKLNLFEFFFENHSYTHPDYFEIIPKDLGCALDEPWMNCR